MSLLRTLVAGLGNTARQFWHPTFAFGMVLVTISWVAAVVRVGDLVSGARKSLVSDIINFGVLLENDYSRTASDLDRILLFLRRTHERGGYAVDWPQLIQERFTVSERTAQIAVINSQGQMITSTAMPNPAKPVDLSDREHFRFQKLATTDRLHVSRPVIGRASGKMSIQFTRRLTDKFGAFAGVLVVSLDPQELMSPYERLEAPAGAGFALIGDDDVIRAGSGSFSGLVGRGFVEGLRTLNMPTKIRNTQIVETVADGRAKIVAVRQVDHHDMYVVVSLPKDVIDGISGWQGPYVFASTFSILVLGAVVTSTRRQVKHMRRITDLAHCDSLTRLPNRLSFRDAISASVTKPESESPVALHLIDLDRFKAVNDTYGHPVGDELLCAVARRLKANLRDTDQVFRLGGDEFALIQSHCSYDREAVAVASRICRVLAEPFVINGHTVFIGASVGIARPGEGLQDDISLLKAADLALYTAKGDGRGTYRVYGSDLNVTVLQRQSLESDMRQAIEGRQFEVHYQKKVSLKSGYQTVGYEALVRWRHPTRGMVAPGEFIAIAEDTGLIVPLGKLVLHEVCREFATRGTETVAVNVSAVQFARDDLVETVTRALADSGLAPDRLEIELTETALMQNEASIIKTLVALRALGIRISLDDFGTGYSSLSYLGRYPIDCIKIDRSFVSRLELDPKAVAITKAIVALAHSLGMTVVAEGVEVPAQVEILTSLNCETAQGYLFGKPEPSHDIWAIAA